MKKVGVLLIFLFVIVCYSCQNEKIDIYVSLKGNNMNNGTKNNPFKTIEKALNNAQLIKRSEHQNIRVHLLEGDYHLTETLLIIPELNNISIIGEGVDKVTIKGSKIIDTKWEPFTENIMITTVNDALKFNQLFINSQ
ncbi:pectinesterase family protein [Lutibacter sp. A64]|uniref:DUF1565 domain-containing protein n=1 Tax=Lutibacter sp. A64 TaxID=2918526 RepID=UPI001F068014|nr:DUF1565 domain-containing protein [Lutibacter sp. A64]UMB52600.1 pectinesterase family protein [Lutibacter sp. A64]